MKLFGINFGSEKPKLQITPSDQEWVEESMLWFARHFCPTASNQVMFSPEYFPKTLSEKTIQVNHLISDFCQQLGLDENRFSSRIFEDVRDGEDMPYATQGPGLDCLLEHDSEAGTYTLSFSKSVLTRPRMLINHVCREMTRAKAMECQIDQELNLSVVLNLAAVHLGFGVLLAQNHSDIGMRSENGWDTKWSYTTDLPEPILAYALAIFARMTDNTSPSWKKELPSEFKAEFELALVHVQSLSFEQPETPAANNLLPADRQFNLAMHDYSSGNIEQAIAGLERIKPDPDDKELQLIVLNNLGYYKYRLGDFEASIPHFKAALEIDPYFGFALDNLGLVLILLGELDAGMSYLKKAVSSGSNDPAYTARNLALYYQSVGDNKSAEIHFQKAFNNLRPVDLLDFYYGQFLLATGDREQGLQYMELSADSGEREGIAFLEEQA